MICTTPIIVETAYGKLVPKYDYSGIRDKYRNSITFYSSGKIKSVYLKEQTEILTTIGKMCVELITFYENGSIHRAFVRFGNVNAYWSEEEELGLVPVVIKEINGIFIQNKIMCYTFYESGAVKGFTLAHTEVLSVDTPIGKVNVRIGITFYENGAIETVEPSEIKLIDTPIGSYLAFHNHPVGIHGDDNSIRFDQNGNVTRFITIMSGISIENKDNSKIVEHIKPKKMRSLLNPELYEVVPIEIQIRADDIVVIDSNKKIHSYVKDENNFQSTFHQENLCSTNHCSECNLCSFQ